MTKGRLMEIVLSEEERTYCDTAIPLNMWGLCDTSLCVYDCRNDEIINLAERLVSSGKLDEIIDAKERAEYQLSGGM